jgi:hypothetical protein
VRNDRWQYWWMALLAGCCRELNDKVRLSGCHRQSEFLRTSVARGWQAWPRSLQTQVGAMPSRIGGHAWVSESRNRHSARSQKILAVVGHCRSLMRCRLTTDAIITGHPELEPRLKWLLHHGAPLRLAAKLLPRSRLARREVRVLWFRRLRGTAAMVFRW